MSDIRTPSFYFEERNKRRKKIDDINPRLDEILIHLNELKGRPNTTKAYKKIVDNEIKRVENTQDMERRKKMSKVIINKMIDGDPSEVTDTIKREIDDRVNKKGEPDLIKSSQEMWRDIFDDKY